MAAGLLEPPDGDGGEKYLLCRRRAHGEKAMLERLYATHAGGADFPDGEERHWVTARLAPDNENCGCALSGVFFEHVGTVPAGDVDPLGGAWE